MLLGGGILKDYKQAFQLFWGGYFDWEGYFGFSAEGVIPFSKNPTLYSGPLYKAVEAHCNF